MTSATMTRLLRAKANELENRVLQDFDAVSTNVEVRLVELAADIAMVAHILAEHIERS